MKKSISLKEIRRTNYKPGSDYYANGRKVSEAKFNSIKKAATKLECFLTIGADSQFTFYSEARF